jgi:FAD/FMN-containing dehydrogenase
MLPSLIAALLAAPLVQAAWPGPWPGPFPGAPPAPSSPLRKWNGNLYSCKCYSDDTCWPAKKDWDWLNSTVGGNLRVHVPAEAACHNKFKGPLGTLSTYDEAACDEVQANYADEQWSVKQDAMLLWKYFTNATSCPPTDDPSTPCTLGHYGVLVIDAHTKHHVKAGMEFARDKNLRLVVRNTGHDFIGRSTGWGALVIRTHRLQDVSWARSYTGPGSYRGRAVTMGAGIQGLDILAQANKQNPPQALMTGECPTVGIVGGLIQGGGHGPWTTLKGMVADHVLSFEVITADGVFRTANEQENPDLYWALKGGGPLTYAVVLSATVKTWDDLPAAGATMFINATAGADEKTIWEGVRIFHKHANELVDSGLYVYFEIWPQTFRAYPFVGIGKTRAQLDAVTAPLRAELRAAGVPFEYRSKEFRRFFDLYGDMFENEQAGQNALTGGWMFSHKDVARNNDKIVDAFKVTISPRADLAYQGGMIGHLWHAGRNMPVANSATHPRFRDSTNFIISILAVPANATLAQRADLQGVLTDTVDEGLRRAGPDGCAYVNEADPYQRGWQTSFFGDNYPRLLSIKRRWDPTGLFWTIATPGSEQWETIEYETRLCKRV